ncbi:MAG TPA: TraR/DksA C4-type zinc finger protein, partial [Myxococcota bacterium]|nr:TraR/DksA C4-type zinc finger protein [Myxococcota bacterium]
WEERAAVLQNTEVWEALEAKDKEEITATQAALARIKAGTYGTCAKCGETIALRRLEALPTTQFCVGCA